MPKIYICTICEWKGSFSELEFDTISSCSGDEKVEVCPKCGSYDLLLRRI